MVCYQVIAQYAIIKNKAVLVSTHIKKQTAKAFLIQSRLPFGSGLKCRRFFITKEEASEYVSYLNKVYKNRIVSYPALPGGQLYLFAGVGLIPRSSAPAQTMQLNWSTIDRWVLNQRQYNKFPIDRQIFLRKI